MDRVNVDPARLQAVDERLRLYTDLAASTAARPRRPSRYLERGRRPAGAPGAGGGRPFPLAGRGRSRQGRGARSSRPLLTAARREAAPALEEAVAAQLCRAGDGFGAS